MIDGSLVHNFLENSARQFPEKVALIHGEFRATYEHINCCANRLANFLISTGIQSGDRVILICENSMEYVIAYYGILKTGAVAVPFNTDLKPQTCEYLISEIGPFAIIFSKKFERLLNTIDSELFQSCTMIMNNGAESLNRAIAPIMSLKDIISTGAGGDIGLDIEQDAIASIIYTSGSTGTPKGVMLTHKNIVTNTGSIIHYLKLTEKDIQMVVLPFFYVMGKSLLNTHFAVGGSIIINNKFAYPATVIEEMIKERVTGFSGVPSTYAYLLNRSPLAKSRDKLSSLRYCSQAGGHMSKAIKIELRNVLPDHTKIYIMYGATEASARLTYLDPDQYTRKIGSIGKPIQGVTLKIIDHDGKEVQKGNIGELVASGDNIMLGYWNDENTSALSSLGYHTGDLGYQDTEGYFFVTGRKDSILKVGGHKINPYEIEEALMETNLLVEVAVIGIPDDMLGNKIVAIVVAKDKMLKNDELLKNLAGKLPRNMMPSDIKFVRSLPKNSSGKTDRDLCSNLATI